MSASNPDIAGRLAASDRTGRVGLLWPDVPFADRWAAHRRVQAAVAAVLRGRTPARLDDGGHPRALGIAAFLAGAGPLLGYWCAQGTVHASAPGATLLADHLAHGRRRAERLRALWHDARAALARAGICAVPLKGVHTAAVYFPEPGTRPCNDVDILIGAADARAARAALRGAGFHEIPSSVLPTRAEWARAGEGGPRSLELAHGEEPLRLDVHLTLDREVQPGRRARLGPVTPGDVDAAGLTQPLLTAHLALHAAAHFPGIPLIRLVELVLVLRRDRQSFTWPALLERLGRYDALRYVYPSLAYVDQLVHGTVPPEVLRTVAAATPRRLVRLVARTEPARALHTSAGGWRSVLAWADGPGEVWRAVGARLWPLRGGWRDLARIYRRRMARLLADDAA